MDDSLNKFLVYVYRERSNVVNNGLFWDDLGRYG